MLYPVKLEWAKHAISTKRTLVIRRAKSCGNNWPNSKKFKKEFFKKWENVNIDLKIKNFKTKKEKKKKWKRIKS